MFRPIPARLHGSPNSLQNTKSSRLSGHRFFHSLLAVDLNVMPQRHRRRFTEDENTWLASLVRDSVHGKRDDHQRVRRMLGTCESQQHAEIYAYHDEGKRPIITTWRTRRRDGF